MQVKRMDDDELLAALAGLARDKQRNDAAMLAHIGEVERRRLHAREGRASMFAYCVEVLGFSESAAGKRIRVARLARRFPVILDLVEGGEVHLSGLCVLGAHLNDGNYRLVLERARGKTRAQIEALVAELAPRPDVPASVKKVGGSASRAPAGQGSLAMDWDDVGPQAAGRAKRDVGPERGAVAAQQAPGPVEQAIMCKPAGKLAARRPEKVEVLAPERYLVKVTLGAEAKAKLDRARALVSHSVPDGNLAAVIERALDALIEKTEKRRFAKASRPRKARPLSKGSRTVPAEVARQVIARDGERCSYRSPEGRRCDSTWLLQFHHLDPFGKGGPPTVENCAIFCRGHNQYAADVDYGARFMRRRRGRVGEAPARWAASG